MSELERTMQLDDDDLLDSGNAWESVQWARSICSRATTRAMPDFDDVTRLNGGHWAPHWKEERP